jgi:uncharacterized protein YdeI (YjbR/CyaY-like superfamily)
LAIAQLKRMTSAGDLPDRRALVALVKAAVDLNDRGVKGPIASRADKRTVLKPSSELLAAFAKAPKARKAFDTLPPSHQREHLQWIAGAKRAATRARRIDQTIAKLLER